MGRSPAALLTGAFTRPVGPNYAESEIRPLRNTRGLGNYWDLVINNPEAIPLDCC